MFFTTKFQLHHQQNISALSFANRHRQEFGAGTVLASLSTARAGLGSRNIPATALSSQLLQIPGNRQSRCADAAKNQLLIH